MIIKDFIKELEKFNPNATISLSDDYSEWDNINISWIDNEKGKSGTKHVFLKGTDY